jgi:REP element-mobilizing transposase RayT
MRQKRKLAQGVWYEIRSRINNREPLFRLPKAAALFNQVFRETTLRFPFEVRDLRIEDDWLTFYIKPEDGMALPKIMQRLKQTFAQRYNALTGRIGHIWGDRYWSLILEGEPPEGAASPGVPPPLGGGAETGVRPRPWKRGRGPRFSAVFPALQVPASG